jgi:hypothetical protein
MNIKEYFYICLYKKHNLLTFQQNPEKEKIVSNSYDEKILPW